MPTEVGELESTGACLPWRLWVLLVYHAGYVMGLWWPVLISGMFRVLPVKLGKQRLGGLPNPYYFAA